MNNVLGTFSDKSGFHLTNVKNITMIYNNLSINTNGIYLEDGNSSELNISYNSFRNIRYSALRLNDLNNSVIQYNEFFRNGEYTTDIKNVIISNGTYISFSNNSITARYGILFTSGSHSCIIESNNFHPFTLPSGNYYGIQVFNSNYAQIKYNSFDQKSDYDIYLDTTENSIIENNIVQNNYKYGIYLIRVVSSDINKNIMLNNELAGIYMSTSHDCNFTENYASQNGINSNQEGGGMTLIESYSNNFLQNIFYMNELNGLFLHNSSLNIIQNNNFSSNRIGYGLWLFQDNFYNTISKNIISNSYDGYLGYGNDGINIDSSSFNNISENEICNNTGYGLFLSYANDNIISKNYIANKNYHGIYMDTSNNNFITSNSIEDNKENGIYLVDSQENYLFNNTIRNNPFYGIELIAEYEEPSPNYIWLNNISSNGWSQVKTNFVNTFHNGTHGNYWGDYLTLYPSATLVGNIWNIPYQINGTSEVFDLYPLNYEEDHSTATPPTSPPTNDTSTTQTTLEGDSNREENGIPGYTLEFLVCCVGIVAIGLLKQIKLKSKFIRIG